MQLLKDKMPEGSRADGEQPDRLPPQPRLTIPTRTDSQKVISKMKNSKFSSISVLMTIRQLTTEEHTKELKLTAYRDED